MTAAELLQSVESRGVVVTGAGGELKVKGKLSPDEAAQVREYKQDLLSLLTRRQALWTCSKCSEPYRVPRIACGVCGAFSPAQIQKERLVQFLAAERDAARGRLVQFADGKGPGIAKDLCLTMLKYLQENPTATVQTTHNDVREMLENLDVMFNGGGK